MWSGKVPTLKHIKICSCEAFVKRDTSDKLESRSERCQFVGYPQDSFGYLFYRPTENVVFVARKRVFLEREMISQGVSTSPIDLEEIRESTKNEPIVDTSVQPEVE